MKKRIVLFITIVSLLLGVLIFTSCGLFGGNQNTDDSSAPTIISIRAEKTKMDYLSSKEYLHNAVTKCNLCLDDGEGYYLIIKYKNPSKYEISSVSIKGNKYTSKDFVSGKSTDEETYIEMKVEDTANTEDITYQVGTVMYIAGSSTKKMQWAKDENIVKSITVSIRPQFKLTLDQQNTDLRIASQNSGTTIESVTSQTVYYNTDLNGILTSPDFKGEGQQQVPTKAGGWIFAGWYTKPNGGGDLVTAEDKFYFWSDITLYAHYVRMYNLKIVDNLSTPITHTYTSSSGAEQTQTFRSGVIVTNKPYNDENPETKSPTLNIPDTIVIEERSYTTEYLDNDVPKYTVSVTYSEYPVIKIADAAFKDFNTITRATEIGKYIEEIGYAAFQGCTKLTDMTFNAGSRLKGIGDYAFENTKVLGATSPFTLPNSIEYLGNFAFRDSGWRFCRNGATSGGGEPKLIIRSTWKFLGYKCFFNTGFSQIIFEPDCYFSGQIDENTGKALESSSGYTDFHYDENLIGANLFAKGTLIESVEFQKDADKENALNIIPDRCFDLFSWEGDSKKISTAIFNEGLKYIGRYAFFYQQNIRLLELPTTLEEVDYWAFYENRSVESLTFGGTENARPEDSKLRVLHSSCFGNLVNIDSVTIAGLYFNKYGSGVFRGCDRLKCIIFDNLATPPVGFKAGENMDGKTDLEVVIGHYQADFLYATGEAGEASESPSDNEKSTYSSPVRIFCQGAILNSFKEELKHGKELHAGSTSSNTSAFNSSVFVHNKNYLIKYENTYEGTTEEVTIAYQEIYANNGNTNSNPVIGYSLVYWGSRSKKIVLPETSDLGLSQANYAPLIEIAMFALPTCVEYVYIPKNYTKIEHDAFNGCYALTKIEYEDINNIQYVGDFAFFGSGITEFEGGTGLMVIGENAFRNCKDLLEVDLRNCPITSAFNGSTQTIQQYKYEYELIDNEKDWRDVIGGSAFQGCSNLDWIYLPENIAQLRTALFSGCAKLKHVIIPAKNVSNETSATGDDQFYQYATPNSVYNSSTKHMLIIYVASEALETHRAICPQNEIRDSNNVLTAGYALLSDIPERIKNGIVRS
ncbi:MAG: leucine-rich repeat protein [Clostridia bacterium]|nr:leucine-rich repeat protein [Clostridia bacterium]